MRYLIAAIIAALLVVPVSAQNRGRRAHVAPRAHYGYRATNPYACAPRLPYGFGPYAHLGPYAPHSYGYYPGTTVDLGLATFLARQQQDFRTQALPYGWTPYDRYGYDIYPTGPYPSDADRYGATAPGRDYPRGGYGSELDRSRPPRTDYVAPRAPVKLRESFVDGVPTLVSDN